MTYVLQAARPALTHANKKAGQCRRTLTGCLQEVEKNMSTLLIETLMPFLRYFFYHFITISMQIIAVYYA